MKNQFLEKFNNLTLEKFNRFRIKAIDVNLYTKSIDIIFLFPEEIENVKKEEQQEILKVSKSILKSGANLKILFEQSHFDKDFFIKDYQVFLENYPAIASTEELLIDALKFDKKGSQIEIVQTVPSTIYDYLKNNNFEKEVKIFLNNNYCNDFIFTIIKENVDISNFDFTSTDEPTVVLERGGGRYIQPINVDALIGTEVYEKAIYIEDAISAKQNLVICGRLVRILELTRKLKEGETEAKKYYKFTIEDFSGNLEALYFPSKLTRDKITLLKEGKEIVVRGNYEQDKRDNKKFVYMVKDISYCTIPEDLVPNLRILEVPKNYKIVEPKNYIEKEQVSMFTRIKDYTNIPSLMNKTFCVFDIETTGLNPVEDRIIEIGAIKIENGVFTQTFSSFVNPQIPIPERITKLTSITDDDVRGQPLIEDVLIDFYKFCNDSVLVAQNIQFDYGFISNKGRPINIHFKNEQMDTLQLARKYVPGLRKYTLGYLTDHFGITLDNAHRAIHDAIATAHLFIKLMSKVDNIA